MSDHHGSSDRKAAFTGLIVGVIFIAFVVVTISNLTNRNLEKRDGGKPTASATP